MENRVNDYGRDLRTINDNSDVNISAGRKRTGMRNTLIIGWNREALNLYDKIRTYTALGYNVKGFITLSDKFEEAQYQDTPLLGGLISLVSWVQFYNIEEILIAIEPEQHKILPFIIDACKNTRVNYRIVSDVYDTVYGDSIHEIYKDLFAPKEFGFRRIIDLAGALVLMLLLFPFFIIVALAIKLESSGSIFYSQIRMGKDGKTFRIFKFRSMVQDAEKKSGPVWAQKKDPRITRVGHFMRTTRIDELPQLMNILKGDMSFIGPRPERPFFIDSFKQQIPLYQKRLECKPGVTGWAQVKWRYDESIEDVKEKLKYDLYYINNHSLWLDIKIAFLTVSTVFSQKGQ